VEPESSITRREVVAGSLGVAGALSVSSTRPARAGMARKPNILVFVADDAGARHFGCYGNKTIRTPNIDRLGAEGVIADNAMLTTSQCSPSRISILSGRYPHSTGAEDLHAPLREGDLILPTHLQSAGYFTGHMQKRHEGPHADRQFQWYDEGLDKFENFLSAAGEKPFFLWVAFSDPHRPYQDGAIPFPHDPLKVEVSPYMVDTPETRSDIAKYYDAIARMDASIGRFRQTLQKRGLSDDTLTIFLSDNGAPFPREKGTVYDSGVRTPLIFHWPRIVPSGLRNKGLMSVIDLAPTLLSIAGAEVPQVMQGVNIASGLRDPSLWRRTEAFSERNWHDTDEHIRSVRTERFRLVYNSYIELPFGSPGDVSRSPSWRDLRKSKRDGSLTPAQQLLFETPRPAIEFYDSAHDIWETTNLAGNPDYDEAIREHFAILKKWSDETGDFPPTRRRRADYVDRVTGVLYSFEVPPMYNP